MDTVIIPEWLDDHLFIELEAKYCRSNCDMTVIDWDKSDILNYLGTYFPRSYAESYCLFNNFIKKNISNYEDMVEISIFDFGCGTGGEIIGLITALSEVVNSLERINVVALDGNQHSLRLYEKISTISQEKLDVKIINRTIPVKIDDFYDLSILDEIISDSEFDIIISFKAVCEFVTKKCFESNNPYAHIAKMLLPKIKQDGMILFADVTSYNDVSQEWLPLMMDKGLKEVCCNVIEQNRNYNQAFYVSHSRTSKDVSKIVWRIIKK